MTQQLELQYADQLSLIRAENEKVTARVVELEKDIAVHKKTCDMRHQTHDNNFKLLIDSEREIKRDLKESSEKLGNQMADLAKDFRASNEELAKDFRKRSWIIAGIALTTLLSLTGWLGSQYFGKLNHTVHDTSRNIIIYKI